MQCFIPVPVNKNIVSQTQLPKTNNSYNNISIKTLNGCKLQISQYSFLYNAEGGRGIGSHINTKEDKFTGQAPLRYDFNLETFHVPPLTSTTAQSDGWIPFPPFLKVDVVPDIIQGNIYEESGKVELKFKSRFLVSMGSSYKAPPLHINMILTTEELKGALTKKSARGMRLGKNGKCKLVGVAKVDTIDDNYINFLLGLPSECHASFKAIISFY